jgi:hypothetical protein
LGDASAAECGGQVEAFSGCWVTGRAKEKGPACGTLLLFLVSPEVQVGETIFDSVILT